MTRVSRRLAATALLAVAFCGPIAAQDGPPVISRPYGRATVEVGLSHARPGGVFGVGVRNARWATANTLLDGRRGAMTNETGRLFGIVPVALDTSPGEHKLSVFFPGGRGRGGATSLSVPVTAVARPGRLRTLSPAAVVSASSQAALGHGRFLLGAIRTRDVKAHHSGPLSPPVAQPVSFPFGGPEDFGRVMGPVKDGLMGEQHRGVDYDTAPGTTVSAPGAGVVLLARSLLFSGETVVIGHGRGLISVLSHLSYVNVREGEVVARGTTLGTSGMTGIGALTPHVCFSVYLHSVNVDPEALMDASLWPAIAGK
jgi:murein DD-endopeptidase MepM/ murein hydrolase activator NlpD